MTTIAYRDGVMACDSCWTYNDFQVASATKIYRIKGGALLGLAGDNDSRALMKMLATVKTPADLPTFADLVALKQNIAALLVFKTGRVFQLGANPPSEKPDDDDESGVWEITLPFAAIGSGREIATTAMACGKSPSDAVRIACRFDINSRLPVHQLKLVEAKRP